MTAAEVAGIPITQQRVGLALTAILGACLITMWWRNATRCDELEAAVITHKRQMRKLAELIDCQHDRIEALAHQLGVVFVDEVFDDSPAAEEQRMTEPATQPIPAQPQPDDDDLPDTVEHPVHVAGGMRTGSKQPLPDDYREINIGGTIRRFYIGNKPHQESA